ncbi:hypothetical protein EYE40_12700 [Glaciihabitans arcticus]|uniref:Uncharacterized protein n=1 Tax=Glaciihabitans arcticus TaxID=2668039 RepID=A0A4Q9GX50_9MICO|nr:phospholipase D family protein [Glaciihabitans arcticus]TBN58178.1 hypothetical protein EYE40_12700 [Glaciihabitans arcticus]
MRSEFLSGPFHEGTSVRSRLQRHLSDETFSAAVFSVAWVKRSGLRLIEHEVRAFTARARLDVLVGIDARGASTEGLRAILELGMTARVIHSPTGGIYHPKVYLFRGSDRANVIIGSSNLTSGGLLNNYETAADISLDLTLPDDAAFLAEIDDYLARATGDATTVDLTMPLIDDLHTAGLVPNEKEVRQGFVAYLRGLRRKPVALPFGSSTQRLHSRGDTAGDPDQRPLA